ncbi:MAG: Tat pathway signal sequence domain protein [Thiocapsa sp.]|nr:Tat pathway signal sequence domain protein [Thiocapsa sp.]MCG6897157.1 Tat pathway signal sequence domain protein [Thiocapsa sp.]MCG6986148.1 Tat pathway signal sequence domain protein [Thiocapsa sp.]
MTYQNLISGLTLLAVSAVATADEIKLELNKLEPQPNACRAYLVFDNSSGSAIDALLLDLILFDRDGVIARRLAVDTAPLRAAKMTVKLFEIPDLACADIGRILVNEVLDCRDANGEHDDCIERLSVSSRADAELLR